MEGHALFPWTLIYKCVVTIVVGGGPSGLATATRLAATASVAVVEARGAYEVDNGNRSGVLLYLLTQMSSVDTTEAFPPSPWMDLGLDIRIPARRWQ